METNDHQMQVRKDGIFFGDFYFIEWDRLRDERDLLHWVWHLGEKTWMTASMLRHFISEVTARQGWNCAAHSC